MLQYNEHKQKPSDRFGVRMIRIASRLDSVQKRSAVNFKWLYSSELSENYHYSRNIVYEKLDIEGLRVESIHKQKSLNEYALIQLHGGAYVLDYDDTYRKMAKKYLYTTENLKVFSPRYRLAPKHPYPAALEDSVKLYKYLLSQGFPAEKIIIAGDSAGGGLALATALYLRDHQLPLPIAIITMSPWTNLAMNGASHEFNKSVDPLFGEGTKPLNVKAYARRNDLTDPYISPKYGDYSKFTDLLMFVGGNELILSDTLDVAEAAKSNNDVIVHNYLGMFHDFPLGLRKMHSSRTAWRIIKEYINEKLRG